MWTDDRFYRALSDAFSAARVRWPALQCSFHRFREWVLQNGLEVGRLDAHGPDLYLACACALGDPAAPALFDRIYLTRIRPLIGAGMPTGDDLAELRQQLRIKLLVGANAKIGQYRGQGSLLSWVRACATRTALNFKRGRFHRASLEEMPIESLASQAPNPEHLLTAVQSRHALSKALTHCIVALTDKEKLLLQMFFVDGHSMERMASTFGVHRATIARWIAALRSRILDSVCQSVSTPLQANRAEVLSSMGLSHCEIDIGAAIEPMCAAIDTAVQIASHGGAAPWHHSANGM